MDLETLITTLLGGSPGVVTGVALMMAIASILDAILPQPGADSPWLPVRKLLSVIAANVRHASNAGQPPLAGPLAKVAGAVLAGQGIAPDPEPTHGQGMGRIAEVA